MLRSPPPPARSRQLCSALPRTRTRHSRASTRRLTCARCSSSRSSRPHAHRADPRWLNDRRTSAPAGLERFPSSAFSSARFSLVAEASSLSRTGPPLAGSCSAHGAARLRPECALVVRSRWRSTSRRAPHRYFAAERVSNRRSGCRSHRPQRGLRAASRSHPDAAIDNGCERSVPAPLSLPRVRRLFPRRRSARRRGRPFDERTAPCSARRDRRPGLRPPLLPAAPRQRFTARTAASRHEC